MDEEEQMGIQKKVAIVTGSSRGIGRAIALRFAREGAHVVVNGRNQETVDAVVENIRSSGGDAIGVRADVSSAKEVEDLFATTLDKYGGVHILVNNAAIAITSTHFLNLSEEYWDNIFTVNLKSLFLCSRHAALVMTRQREGCIVNISSVGAARSHREDVAYDAAKGAMEAATRGMALDLAAWGIRVNALGPGAIPLETWGLDEAGLKRVRETIPLGREGTPEDVAGAVAFLASDDAAYVTGQVFYVDGGLLAQLRSPQADIEPTVKP
jgi:3-oxoacyl-[acyl-carrier protein] reductase